MYYTRATKGKKFTAFLCWEAVKDHQKFKTPPKGFTQPSSTVEDSPVESATNLDADNDEEEPSEVRPPGRKAQKKDARLKGKIEEKQDRYIQVMENIAFNSEASREATRIRDEENVRYIMWQQQMEVEKQQLEVQKVQLEIQKEENWVMAKDISTMTPESKAWWKKRKKAIRDKTSTDWEGGLSGD
jgi:HD superfamily phosphodiesterase